MTTCGHLTVDQVVVENGTAPLDDVYFELKPGSANLGEVDAGDPEADSERGDGRSAEGES